MNREPDQRNENRPREDVELQNLRAEALIAEQQQRAENAEALIAEQQQRAENAEALLAEQQQRAENAEAELREQRERFRDYKLRQKQIKVVVSNWRSEQRERRLEQRLED